MILWASKTLLSMRRSEVTHSFYIQPTATTVWWEAEVLETETIERVLMLLIDCLKESNADYFSATGGVMKPSCTAYLGQRVFSQEQERL